MSRFRRSDPTGTLLLRRSYARWLESRLESLLDNITATGNLVSGRVWGLDLLESQLSYLWTEGFINRGGFNRSINTAYEAGLERGRDLTLAGELAVMDEGAGELVKAWSRGVLRDAGSVSTLRETNKGELVGVGDEVAMRARRLANYGKLKGRSRGELEGSLFQEIREETRKVAGKRLALIAHTEIPRAFNTGLWDAMKVLKVTSVKVVAESESCKLCSRLDNKVVRLDEVRGTFPLHPRCKCSFIPFAKAA